MPRRGDNAFPRCQVNRLDKNLLLFVLYLFIDAKYAHLSQAPRAEGRTLRFTSIVLNMRQVAAPRCGIFDSVPWNAPMARSTLLTVAVIAASSLLQTPGHAAEVVSAPPVPPVHTTVVPFALMACPASIILSGIVANFWENRQLTFAEAWSCGLLYWIPRPAQKVISTRG